MDTNETRSDNTLRLNRERRKLLGVCSGFARYLDVPVALVRLIYVIACLVSPALIFVYFVLYWVLEEDNNPSKVRVYVPEKGPEKEAEKEPAATRFRRIDYRRPLYRSRDNAWIGGVCAGIAEYLRIRRSIVRVVAVLSLFVFGGVTLWAYIAGWIILDKKPREKAQAVREQADEADGTTEHDPARVMQDCAETLLHNESRLRQLEAFMTSRTFRLHCEINRI